VELAGPLRDLSRREKSSDPLVASCASADLLLTLALLDLSVGGEHLATWAANAVVVITSGRSTWTRIHAVSEMIRLAGTRLDSAVLVGADKTDESLGITHAPETGHDAEVAEQSPRSDAQDVYVTADGGHAVTADRGHAGG